MQEYYSHCSQYIHSLSSQLLTDDQEGHFAIAKYSCVAMIMHYVDLIKIQNDNQNKC